MDERLSQEAVENLVTQFSSALDFYRELVQNSIDAGTEGVDVWMDFEPGEHDEGTISIHIDDFGEGMNSEIIDNQLTKLFSSTKENDLTKIGKFGIGFVSVFALRPKAVLIHTGRDGEFWEVLFHEDRSFNKTAIDTPVEGTQITLFVGGDRGRYKELVEGSIATLRRWCSHSDTDVTFEDRSADPAAAVPLRINEPFAVAGKCAVEATHPGTEIVAAYSVEPIYGFYNKGLALAVTGAGDDILAERANRFRHITFKIKSRYLEHTLSRETVMRDDNYEKAMALLDQAVEGPLRSELVATLTELTARADWTLAQYEEYRALIRFLAHEPPEALSQFAQAPILRTVHKTATNLARVQQAAEGDGRVFVSSAPSDLSQVLHDRGIPVLQISERGDAVGELVTRYAGAHASKGLFSWLGALGLKIGDQTETSPADLLTRPEAVMMRVQPDDEPSPPGAALIAAAAEILARMSNGLRRLTGKGYGKIVGGRILGLVDRPALFVLGPKIEPIMQLPTRGAYERGSFERPHVLVNRDHPHFRSLDALFTKAPALAAYCLAKSLLLVEDREIERDLELMMWAVPERAG